MSVIFKWRQFKHTTHFLPNRITKGCFQFLNKSSLHLKKMLSLLIWSFAMIINCCLIVFAQATSHYQPQIQIIWPSRQEILSVISRCKRPVLTTWRTLVIFLRKSFASQFSTKIVSQLTLENNDNIVHHILYGVLPPNYIMQYPVACEKGWNKMFPLNLTVVGH